ncbi:prepilin-type N-terminal cleavage/methylation domain-containing protein [Yersinia ruckeri]|nr:prepilin-type N-terminal cleavage/methylation domain-containing protein [Yersinia ruckeri]
MHSTSVKFTKQIHKGFGLLEIIVVVLIMAVILGGISGRIGDSSGATEIGSEAGHVVAIINNAKQLKDSAGYKTGSLIPDLNTFSGIPSDMKNNGTTVENTWGGDVLVTGAGTSFTVSYANVPIDACAKITSRLSKSSLINQTTINGKTIVGEVSIANTTTNCNTASNTLVWKVTQ